ncbi:DUF4249 family protein [Aquimarina longa]|uniref:DUF4249 family protein n=1 Tax=Aquimarina longa TaxID=1080221 RepID=UPI0007828519|nr:DUF4249 family protein [Aquimarina longa]
MNFKIIRKYLLVLTPLFFIVFNSCEDKKIEVPLMGSQQELALTGELNQVDTIQVILAKAGNLTIGSQIEEIKQGEVLILNDKDEIIDQLFYNNNKKKWKSNKLNQIKVDSTYKIDVQLGAKKLMSTTVIPNPIDVTIVEITEKETEILIDIDIENPNQSSAFSTISLLSKQKNSFVNLTNEYFRVAISTNDEETDNIKFNELRTPFSKLFLSVKGDKKKRLRFSVKKEDMDIENYNYFIWTKSTKKQYYKYLYDYEVQKNTLDFTNLPQLQSNINGGLGFWGGCFKDVKKIDF